MRLCSFRLILDLSHRAICHDIDMSHVHEMNGEIWWADMHAVTTFMGEAANEAGEAKENQELNSSKDNGES